MAAVWYRLFLGAKPVFCKRTDLRYDWDTVCHKCGYIIPAGTKVVSLLSEAGENVILHEACADRCCSPADSYNAKWEISKGNKLYAFGSEIASMPGLGERLQLRAEGFTIWVDGEPFHEDKN